MESYQQVSLYCFQFRVLPIFHNWKQYGNDQDIPGEEVVKNLPSNARDGGSIPSRGTKTPHASEQLESQRSAAREGPHNATEKF